MSKRILSVLLILSLVITVLAACSGVNKDGNKDQDKPPVVNNNNKEGASKDPVGEDTSNQYGDTGGLTLPLVDKPTKITWMVVSENEVNDKLIAKEILKRTGIEVDFQAYSSQIYQERLRVILGSGNLPDIFHGLKPAELKQIGQDGGVVAINKYLDALPNFKKLYIDDNPWVISSYGDEQGDIYTWPIHNMNRDVNHGFIYRKDIFDLHGIKEWTNTAEFKDALVALKKAYPNSYPYASKTKGNIFRDWAYGWGTGGTYYPTFYDEASKEWKYGSIQPQHKDMLDFMKELYSEGLIDPEFITDTPDSWTVKMTNNDQAFVTFDWIGILENFYNQVKDVNPSYDLRYTNPVGPTGNIRTLPRIDPNFGITVSNGPNAEVALKLLDYLTSPSGAELVTLGVEGETFNFDANGKPVYPELGLDVVGIKDLENNYGLWIEGMYLNPDRRSVYYNFTEKEQEAQDKINSAKLFEPLDPVLNFTDEENSRIAELQTELLKAVEEFNTKYVLDKNYGSKQWEEWQDTAKKMGAAEMVDIFTAAQKRYDAAMQ